MAAIPSVKLNNGKSMPVLGLGTYGLQGEEGKNVVKAAIDAGYRHFDTALVYHTEKPVGEAIKEKIEEGVISREEVFITSKLWCSYAHPGLVVKGCQRTLQELELDYVDLYLIHWPFSFKAIKNPDAAVTKEINPQSLFAIEEYFPRDASGNLVMCDVDHMEIWKEMEMCVERGMAKSIGVSNFNSKQLDNLIKKAKIKPVVNQVELHPYFNQKQLIRFCKERDVLVTGYSSLRTGFPRMNQHALSLFENPTIVKIAKEVNKTPAQVILRYVIQLGATAIPKSSSHKRLAENAAIFDFTLSPEQMSDMDTLNCNQRICSLPGTENHKHYPFREEF